MEEQKQNANGSFLKKNKIFVGVMAVMAIIIVAAIVTFITQPPIPSASSVYEYMQNNFNSSLAAYQGVANISVYNNTIYLPGNPIDNISAEKVNLRNISSSDKTYIFFFGLQASGQSAVETYVLWNYLTKQPNFPPYSTSFISAQGSTPIIPEQYISENISSSNPVFVEKMVPLSYQQAVSQSNSSNTDFVAKWLAYNLTLPEAYVFAVFGKGNFPQVDVVRTLGNKTIICNGFSAFTFILYNETSSTRFLGINTEGQTFGTLLATPASINQNLNTLNLCVEKVERWNGD